MNDEDAALLRERDPLYLIPTTYQPKHGEDYPPWMSATSRQNNGNEVVDYKMWKHRYKFFSHALANRREEQHCQFYGSMSKEDTMNIAKRASHRFPNSWPELDANKFTY